MARDPERASKQCGRQNIALQAINPFERHCCAGALKMPAVRGCVFVDRLPFHVQPNHTDWRVLLELARVSEYETGWTLKYPQGTLHAIRENGLFLLEVFHRRLGFKAPILPGNRYEGKLDRRSLEAANADLVYSHSGYPMNAGDWPVFWRNTVLDPNMQLGGGTTPEDIATEVRLKRPLFKRATLVHVSTAREVDRLNLIYPECAGKFVNIPYFLPHLRDGLPRDMVAAKQRGTPITLLFVGRYGRRKGLDLLLEGVRVSGLANRSDFQMTVVCGLSDGVVDIPTWSNLKHLTTTTRAETEALMRRAHIFAMPSRFESYGIVFVEAMAAGAIPVVPNWEVQREIVGDGSAGFVVSHRAEDIGMVLERLVRNEALRVECALAAVARFEEHFAAAVVARRFAEGFSTCLRVDSA